MHNIKCLSLSYTTPNCCRVFPKCSKCWGFYYILPTGGAKPQFFCRHALMSTVVVHCHGNSQQSVAWHWNVLCPIFLNMIKLSVVGCTVNFWFVRFNTKFNYAPYMHNMHKNLTAKNDKHVTQILMSQFLMC